MTPTALTINNNIGQEILRITADGQVIVNPDFTVDQVAYAFWEAVKKLAVKDASTKAPASPAAALSKAPTGRGYTTPSTSPGGAPPKGS